MVRLVIELTNRCNLRCLHCFTERHAATGDLPLTMLEKSCTRAKAAVLIISPSPVTLNMILTAQNRGEVEAMVRLATRLEAGGCALAT